MKKPSDIMSPYEINSIRADMSIKKLMAEDKLNDAYIGLAEAWMNEAAVMGRTGCEVFIPKRFISSVADFLGNAGYAVGVRDGFIQIDFLNSDFLDS